MIPKEEVGGRHGHCFTHNVMQVERVTLAIFDSKSTSCHRRALRSPLLNPVLASRRTIASQGEKFRIAQPFRRRPDSCDWLHSRPKEAKCIKRLKACWKNVVRQLGFGNDRKEKQSWAPG
jgi:hypothetical protein